MIIHTEMLLKNQGIFMKPTNKATTIYVGNLRYTRTEEDVYQLFKRYGRVISAKLILDKKTQKSKAIAFVRMQSKDAAEMAISQLNGKEVDGRTLKVSIAIENNVEAKPIKKYKPIEKEEEKVVTKRKVKTKPKPKGLELLFNYLNK